MPPTWFERLRRIYPVRRKTAVGPLLDAFRVRAIVRRVDGSSKKLRVLGPAELAPYVRLLTAWSPAAPLPEGLDFDQIVVRQEWLTALDRRLVQRLGESYRCAHANARYVLFSLGDVSATSSRASALVEQRLRSLLLDDEPAAERVCAARSRERAILVTTFGRPAALRRSLPQIVPLGCPILVVDDGSEGWMADENRAICERAGAHYLRLPENRGVATAVNIGIAYLLAECRFAWISWLQDDVDVDPCLMDRLTAVEHRDERPLLTGYDANEHGTIRDADIGGVPVKLKASTPGVHLHAHRNYWEAVLPIPVAYLGAPRRRWGPPLEDHWIVRGAPTSAGARGLLIPCLPGLVRTFVWHPADSTWMNGARRAERPC